MIKLFEEFINESFYRLETKEEILKFIEDRQMEIQRIKKDHIIINFYVVMYIEYASRGKYQHHIITVANKKQADKIIRMLNKHGLTNVINDRNIKYIYEIDTITCDIKK